MSIGKSGKNNASGGIKIVNKYFIFLFLLVIISYGQITAFTPWEDDNALFFKLNHLQESAGFLGPGVFGTGPYRYTAAFYLPLFYIFNNFFPAYYIYSLFFYFLATITVYLSFSKIINKTGGQVAGFLFGCGYIASDGFIRLFNSVPTSISIISACFFLLSYWKYRQYNKILYLILTLLFFTATLELAPSRTHYLISIVFILEIILLSFTNFLKQLFFSLTRLSLFSFIFYKYFLESADGRSGNTILLIHKILRGHLWNLQGFFITLTNLTTPGWFINTSLNLQTELILVSNLGIPWLKLVTLAAGLIFCLILLRTRRISYQITLLSATLLLIWAFILNHLFINPTIKVSEETLLRLFLGGEIIILLTLLSQVIAHQQRRLYLLLLSWILLNIVAYIAYDPEGNIPQISRYLAHSFFPLVGLMALIFTSFWRKSMSGTLISLAILVWGVNNLVSSVFYQSDFRQNRVLPIENFYHQLSSLTPHLPSDSILYFDVSENSLSYFFDATTSSQMPDTTAIALRYGLDRNAIKVFQDFNDFKNYLTKNPLSVNNIHTYFYNNQNLLETTGTIKQALNKRGQPILYTQKFINQSPTNPPIIIHLPTPISSSLPLLLNITASAYPLYSNFSITPSSSVKKILVKQAFDYQSKKFEILSKIKFSATSEWHNNITANLFDNNPDTYWQPNRVLWKDKKEAVIIELPKEEEIGGLVWVNKFADNTPVKYILDTSSDGSYWQDKILSSSQQRIEDKNPIVLSFPPERVKFIKMTVLDTFNGDSPTIAEIWLIKGSLEKLDILNFENILKHPFAYIDNQDSFLETLSLLSYQGKADIYWMSNKSDNWQKDSRSNLQLKYDGQEHTYQTTIPAGGTLLTDIKIDFTLIPGKLKVNKITIIPASLYHHN